jgi:hypothetical protein
MGVSKNGGTPKCMAYKGKSYYCKTDDWGTSHIFVADVFTLVDTFPSQHACMGRVKSFGIP